MFQIYGMLTDTPMLPVPLSYQHRYLPCDVRLLSHAVCVKTVCWHGNQFLNDGVNSTPQATAVKLAQLGEGDSPQCGEMSA